jgi:hypothetical protein
MFYIHMCISSEHKCSTYICAFLHHTCTLENVHRKIKASKVRSPLNFSLIGNTNSLNLRVKLTSSDGLLLWTGGGHTSPSSDYLVSIGSIPVSAENISDKFSQNFH